MATREQNTETIILQAAEDEFLEKGYGNAKMLSIAQRAGVSHSMLHYYFRNKENMFQQIFMKKIQTITGFIKDIFDKELPFDKIVRLIMEAQFKMMSENPKLPLFMINEVVSNKENRIVLLQAVYPHISGILNKISNILDTEIKNGRVRPISINDFMMNIIALNASTFIALPILSDFLSNQKRDEILNARRESNIQFVIHALRP